MYSTRFDDEQRYIVTCISNSSHIRLLETIVDTGAKYTCYRAGYIDSSLREERFADKQWVDIGGFIDGDSKKNSVRFYKYSVNQFTIGNIDLGNRDVWITFDSRVKDNVLGMDILKTVTYLQLNDSQELDFFSNNDELKSYVNNFI